jgi:hypothetical protein
MAELVRQVQAVIFAAATTMHLWRDAAIMLLALAVVGLLLLYVDQATTS